MGNFNLAIIQLFQNSLMIQAPLKKMKIENILSKLQKLQVQHGASVSGSLVHACDYVTISYLYTLGGFFQR